MKAPLIWAFAFAAGFLGWRAAAPVAASAPEAPPSPEAAEARELRNRLALLETVPLRDLVRYGNEPLGDRMQRARGLAEAERRQTLQEWARFAVYDRAMAQEMLALVREEEDREILSWLAEMINLACLGKMNLDPTFTDEEKRATFPLAISGQPFERRIAALRVIGGDRFDAHKPDMQALLADVLRRDPEPLVVAAAAEEVEHRYAPDAIPELLPAWRRLAPGVPRQSVARAYARWAEGPELVERFREARGAVDHDEWARAAAAFLYKLGREDVVAVYRGTTSRDIRRDLFHALSNASGRDLMREVADVEKDQDLLARYEKVLAAADPNDPLWSSKVDVSSILYR